MQLGPFISYLSLEKKYSPHTVKAYENDISEFTAFCEEVYELDSIDDVDYNLIRSWIVSLVEQQLSNRSINRKIASLKAYYKFLLSVERIKVSPLAKHKALKTSKKVEIPFSEAEMERLLNQIQFEDDFKGIRNKLIIELLYTTGIRRAELINLKIKDVDTGGRTMKVLGKRSKERIVPLLPSVVKLFLRYFELREKLSEIKSTDRVFLSESGNKIYETLVYRIINEYLSKVSSKVKKSPHILRHTFATHLLNKGADLNSVKELLGHSSLASTQVYTHNSIAELKKIHSATHPRSQE